MFVDVSAKQKTNLNLLMEMICLVADLQDLRANADRPATGVVLEAKLDRGRGPVATVLVQNGTLRTGDNFVVGNVYGKVRTMFDDRGGALQEAPPSSPVEILGITHAEVDHARSRILREWVLVDEVALWMQILAP